MTFKKFTIKKRERRWTLRREKAKKESELKLLEVDDPKYKLTLEAVEKTTKVRNSNIDTFVNFAQKLGMLGLAIGATLLAYSVDKSDNIPRNKQSMNIFNKFLKF
jgi:hypothetical protein